MEITVNSHLVIKFKDLEKYPEVFQTIKNENTFLNPVYATNVRSFRSNKGVDKFINTVYGDLKGNIIIARGYGSRLKRLLNENEIEFDVIDERKSNHVGFGELEGYELRDYQLACVNQAMRCDQGMFISPTGSGKSIIGIEIIRRSKEKALIIVHRSDLARQWQAVIYQVLGIDAPIIGGGKEEIGDKITIAMVQTLSSRSDLLNSLSEQIGLVLVDEAHHVPATTFRDVLGGLRAKRRFGLSATPQRGDGLMEMIYRLIGPSLYEVERVKVLNQGSIIPVQAYILNSNLDCSPATSWHQFVTMICEDEDRCRSIAELASKQTSPTLILTDRVSHAEKITWFLKELGCGGLLIHGKCKNREELMAEIENARITVATTGLMGEGIDVKKWAVLILATPISSSIKLSQAIGRVIRPYPGKNTAIIYDIKDDCGFSGASLKKRLEIYKDLGVRYSLSELSI